MMPYISKEQVLLAISKKKREEVVTLIESMSSWLDDETKLKEIANNIKVFNQAEELIRCVFESLERK
jgi:hypothetical protein